MINKHKYDYFYLNGVFASAADTISSGTMLICFASLLGAGNIYISLLISMPYFANLMNLVGGYFIDNGVSCKKLALFSSVLSKPMCFFIALLPMFNNNRLELLLLFLFIVVLYFMGSISGGAFNIWMKTLLEPEITGQVLAKRFKYMMLVQLVLYVFIYFLFKYVRIYFNHNEINVYQILFVLAFIFGLLVIMTFLKLEEKRDLKSANNQFFVNLKESIKNRGFRNSVLYLGVFNYLMYLTIPYVTVYMIKHLGFDTATVVIFTLFNQAAYILSADILGRVVDKESVKTSISHVLMLFSSVAGGFLIFSLFKFGDIKFVYIITAMLQILLGVLFGMFQITLNNSVLQIASSEKKAAQISIIRASNSLFQGLGTSCAGLILLCGNRFENSFGFFNTDGWMMFFSFTLFLSFVLFFVLKKLTFPCEMK